MGRRRGKPHDRLLRAVLRSPADARAVLREFLPAKVRDLCSFDSLRREPGSFVDERLRARFSDALFSVRARDEDLLVYVLLEHVRVAPRRLPFFVLRYVTRILEQHAEEHPHDDALPRVVGLVVHQGDAPYRGALRMADLYPSGAGSSLARFTPEFDFVLVDLALIPDEALLGLHVLGAAFAAAALLLMKHVGDPELSRRLEAWMGVLRAAAGGSRRAALMRLLSYVVAAAQDEAAPRALLVAAPEAEEVYMTLAKRWLQEGRTEGRAEGRTEGRAEGRTEGRTEGERLAQRRALARLLESRFGPLDAAVRAQLDAAETRTLEAWFDRALAARSLEEILASP
ncbi:MAG: Rpn family recombination-promoting nuclease/putative transposase [Planctomycetes bacterium]|nr:Rpn family recombination-promoting nuclease/putative transposase [Planctomycetota bacterium]